MEPVALGLLVDAALPAHLAHFCVARGEVQGVYCVELNIFADSFVGNKCKTYRP